MLVYQVCLPKHYWEFFEVIVVFCFFFTVKDQERPHPIGLVILNSNHTLQLLLGMFMLFALI